MSRSILMLVIIILVIGVAAYILLYMRPNNTQNVTLPEQEDITNEAQDTLQNAGATIAETKDQMTKVLTATLQTQNNSGEQGTAVLSEVDGKVVVTINMQGAPTTAQPAHIHSGECPKPGAIAYPLTNVVNGQSETTLDVSMQGILDQLPLAVNVHKSQAELQNYVTCGNVPGQ